MATGENVRNPLKNKMRRAVYERIVESPGMYFADLKNFLGLNNGAVDYHLRILKITEYVREELGWRGCRRTRRYYPTQPVRL